MAGASSSPLARCAAKSGWAGYPHVNAERSIRVTDDKDLPAGVWSISIKAYRAVRLELEGVPPYIASRPDGVFPHMPEPDRNADQ